MNNYKRYFRIEYRHDRILRFQSIHIYEMEVDSGKLLM